MADHTSTLQHPLVLRVLQCRRHGPGTRALLLSLLKREMDDIYNFSGLESDDDETEMPKPTAEAATKSDVLKINVYKPPRPSVVKADSAVLRGATPQHLAGPEHTVKPCPTKERKPPTSSMAVVRAHRLFSAIVNEMPPNDDAKTPSPAMVIGVLHTAKKAQQLLPQPTLKGLRTIDSPETLMRLLTSDADFVHLIWTYGVQAIIGETTRAREIAETVMTAKLTDLEEREVKRREFPPEPADYSRTAMRDVVEALLTPVPPRERAKAKATDDEEAAAPPARKQENGAAPSRKTKAPADDTNPRPAKKRKTVTTTTTKGKRPHAEEMIVDSDSDFETPVIAKAAEPPPQVVKTKPGRVVLVPGMQEFPMMRLPDGRVIDVPITRGTDDVPLPSELKGYTGPVFFTGVRSIRCYEYKEGADLVVFDGCSNPNRIDVRQGVASRTLGRIPANWLRFIEKHSRKTAPAAAARDDEVDEEGEDEEEEEEEEADEFEY